MKTALIVGGAAVAIYIGWRLFMAPRPADQTSAGSASAAATSSMTSAGAQQTIAGLSSVRGVLPTAPAPSWIGGGVRLPFGGGGFAASLASATAAEDAPALIAPAPSAGTFQVVNLRGVRGTAPAGDAPRPGDPSGY